MSLLRSLYVSILCIFSLNLAFSQALKGKFTNAPTGSKVYLFRYFGTQYFPYDSTKVDNNGNFQFSFTKKPSRGFYQLGKSSTESAMFILGKEQVEIQADFMAIKSSFKISNSRENTFLQLFMSSNAAISKLQQQAQQIGNDQVALSSLQVKYDSLSRIQNDVRQRAMMDTSLLFTKILRMFETPEDATPENYFTPRELTEKEYLYGDMMLNKIMFYFQRYGGSEPGQWTKLAEMLLSKTSPKSENRLLVSIHIIQAFQQSGQTPPSKAVSVLQKEFSGNKIAASFMATLPPLELQEGDVAPEITLTDVEGNPRSLSSLRGKVVLLDFWASWCGPCRMENPNVVRVYEKYSSKGFDIFSVSLDSSKEAWLGAISRDRLVWASHVSDLKGWGSEGARLYNVRAIPMTFLLDKNGVIVAKNLRGPALEQKLIELLP